MAVTISFDRGTLRIDGAEHPGVLDDLQGCLWDPRTACHRAPAHVYRRVCDAIRRIVPDVADHVALRLALPSARWRVPPLRAYQEGAVAAWHALGRRGIIALPTGSGKTRVAIAALASMGRTTLILCPTRVLLEQWGRELANWYDGAIGIAETDRAASRT